jgi:hypothetical protein
LLHDAGSLDSFLLLRGSGVEEPYTQGIRVDVVRGIGH